MASFMGAVDIFRAVCRGPRRSPSYPTLPENNFIDAPGLRQAAEAEHRCPRNWRDDAEYPAPGLPRRDRHAADARRRRGASWPTSGPTAGPGWSTSCCERPEYRRLLGSEMGGPAPRRSAGAGAQAGLRLLPLDSRQPGRTTSRCDQFAREIADGRGPARETGPANFYKVVDQAGRDGQHAVAGVPGRAHRLCRVPSSSVRPLEPDRLLRHAGVLHAAGAAADRRAARLLLAQGDPATKHPRTGEAVSAARAGREPMPAQAAADGRSPAGCWPTG